MAVFLLPWHWTYCCDAILSELGCYSSASEGGPRGELERSCWYSKASQYHSLELGLALNDSGDSVRVGSASPSSSSV